MRQHILFDLDGTLTDPMIGITKSVRHALKHYGYEVEDLRELIPFIGPPLSESFEKFYGLSHEDAMEAVEIYREYYRPTGIFENDVYPGIPDLLRRLRDDGFSLYVATSKPEVFAKQIIEHFDLQEYFTLVGGSELDGGRVHKDEAIAYVLETCGISPDEAVMVGDREHDVLGATGLGIPCIGVLFGYGSKEELERAGAAALAADVPELEEMLRRAGA